MSDVAELLIRITGNNVDITQKIADTGKQVSGFGQTVQGAVGQAGANLDSVGAKVSSFGSKAQSAFTGIGNTLRASSVELGPFESAIDAIGASLDKVGEKGKGFSAGLGIAGGALTSLGAIGLTAASGLEKSEAQLKAAADAAGISQDQLSATTKGLASHMENLGNSNAQTNEALRQFVQAGRPASELNKDIAIAADLAAAKHISLSSAATMVAKVYGGNTKTLKQYGIDVTTSANGTKNFAGAVTELGQKLQGQAQASVDSFGGHLDVLKTKAFDLAASVGEKAGPALATIGPIMMGVSAITDSALLPALGGIVVAIGPIVLAIGAVVAAGLLLWHNWDTISAALTAAWNAIETAAVAVWDGIKAATVGFVTFVGTEIGNLISFYVSLPGRILGALAALPADLLNLGKNAATGLYNGVVDGGSAVLTWFVGLPGRIVAGIGDLAGLLVGTGQAVITGLWNGAMAVWSAEWTWLASLPAAFVNVFGSAATLLLNTGTEILGGLRNGAVTVWLAVWSWLSGLPAAFINAFGNAGTILYDVGTSVFGGLQDGVLAVWDGVWSWLTGLPARIRAASVGMWDGIKDAFKAAVNTIIRGWNSLHFHIPGFHIGPVGYDGFDLGVPQIPLLDMGGIVKSPTLAMLAGNSRPEAVIPLDRLGGGGANVTIHVHGSVMTERQLARSVWRSLRNQAPLLGDLGLG